ncbi:MAG: hypothetical protein Crog4KO_36240 [Crocinitomicaceae bacterium]
MGKNYGCDELKQAESEELAVLKDYIKESAQNWRPTVVAAEVQVATTTTAIG